MNKKGFTLIEILVVVAIIAILSSVVLIGLGPTRRLGRDARRVADLKETQNALELYFNKCGFYPGVAQANATCSGYTSINGSSWSAVVAALTGSNIGVTSIPNDPNTGANYTYASAANGTGYVLMATLEDPSSQSLNNSPKGLVFGVSCDSPNYCVRF